MKKLKNILTATLIFSIVSINATNTITVSFSDTSNSSNLNTVYSFVGTATNHQVGCCAPINIKMKIVSVSLPMGCGVSICSPSGCNAVGVDSTTFLLNQNTSGTVGVDFHIGNNPGTGTAKIRWVNLSDTNNITEITFMISISTAGIATISSHQDLALSQNYPNPFSTQTTIKYFLQEDGNTNFIVYDAAGKIVRHQLLENKQGEVVLNANDFSKGIYFYTIEQNNKAITTKRLLIN